MLRLLLGLGIILFSYVVGAGVGIYVAYGGVSELAHHGSVPWGIARIVVALVAGWLSYFIVAAIGTVVAATADIDT